MIKGNVEQTPNVTAFVPSFPLALLSPDVSLAHCLHMRQLFGPAVLVLPQAHNGHVGVMVQSPKQSGGAVGHAEQTLHPLLSSCVSLPHVHSVQGMLVGCGVVAGQSVKHVVAGGVVVHFVQMGHPSGWYPLLTPHGQVLHGAIVEATGGEVVVELGSKVVDVGVIVVPGA